MSIWSRIGAIGLGVVGAATGNPALIGAGVGVFRAGETANAAKKAAAQQTEAAQKAIDYSRQNFEQSRANLQPYVNAGQGSLALLSQGMGLQDPRSQPAPQLPQQRMYPTPTGQAPPGYDPEAGGRALVTLRAPDGSIQQKPASEVSFWLSRGAKAVPEAGPGSIGQMMGAQ